MENPVYQVGFPPAKAWLHELDYANAEMISNTEWSRLESIGTMLINSGLVGEYTPQDTMDRMAEAFTKVMDRAGYYKPGARVTPSAYWPNVRDAFIAEANALFDRLGV